MPLRGSKAPQSPSYPGDLVEHLRAFVMLATVIEQRSVSNTVARAAANLALDPSVLRRRLQTLTEHAGAPLLTGRGSNLHLTPIGVRVRDVANKLLALAADVAVPRNDDGPLRVACTGTILAEVLPGVLAPMRKKYDQLRLQVRRAGSEAARALVTKGEVDFAIVRSTEQSAPQEVKEATEGLEARRLGRDHLWLALSSRSELAQARRLSLAAIAKEPLIGYAPTSSTMRRVLQVLGPLGAVPSIEVDRKAAALAYVAAELGVAFVSIVGGKPNHRGVIVREVTALFPRAAFWLLWVRGRALRGWRKDFVDRMIVAMQPVGSSPRSDRQSISELSR